jgi:hypothetical protein
LQHEPLVRWYTPNPTTAMKLASPTPARMRRALVAKMSISFLLTFYRDGDEA